MYSLSPLRDICPPVMVAALLLTFASAQQPAPPLAPAAPPAVGDDLVPMQMPNAPVETVLQTYEKLTGKRIIRDSTLGQGVTLNIYATTPIKKDEAVRLIESTLLLNGFALTPGPDGSMKALNVLGGGKNPRSEGVPVYANLSSLPPGDQVVSYFMALRYLSAAEAVTIFQQQVAPHAPYGTVVAVPNAQALIITETSSAIRELAKLQKLVDVPPAKVVSEFVPLLRSDAERVADTLTKMLEARRNNQTALGQPPAPSPDFSDETGPNERNIVAGTVQLIPDARTNRILVVTRPVNFAYIKNLILQFDEAASISEPFERTLKYVSAGEVLPVLQKALADTKEDAQASQQGQGAQNQQNRNQRSGGGGSESVVDDIQNPTEDSAPESVTVGKTKLIADKRANSILVIGPPESITRARDILDKLDTAPRQVYLATIIGELTLNNDYEFGIDLLQKWSGGQHNSGVASQLSNTSATILDPRTLTSAAAFPTGAGIGGLTVYGAIGSTLNYYVRALQSTGRFKILSRPSVYTSNNKRAIIASGQQIPIPGTTQSTVNSGTTNNAVVSANVEYVPVELKLAVIPLINAQKEITLEIAQKNDTVGATSNIGGNEVPAINTQQFTTSVTVPNRQTVVLGGLIISSYNETVTGLPWLSDIPILGLLFKDTTKSRQRREVIILIEPNVIESQEDLTAASQREQDKTIIGSDARKMGDAPGTFDPSPDFKPRVKSQKNDYSSKP